jgi:hypothetical protein
MKNFFQENIFKILICFGGMENFQHKNLIEIFYLFIYFCLKPNT